MYPPRDVELADRLPLHLTALEDIARRSKMPADALLDRLTEISASGIGVRLGARRHRYSLAALVLGFFEFTFMRTSDNLPLGELPAI